MTTVRTKGQRVNLIVSDLHLGLVVAAPGLLQNRFTMLSISSLCLFVGVCPFAS